MRPETRYARSGDVSLAFQTFGGGPVELLIPFPFLSHLEYNWDYPPLARYLELLGSLGRVTAFNQRGVGLSDPVAGVPTLEERVADMLAVMEAAGIDRASVCAMSDGGPVAMLFAAAHPERVERLHLYATFARRETSSALGAGDPEEIVAALSAHWGNGEVTSLAAPSLAEDDRHRAWAARLERVAASPATIARLARASVETDVRHVLPNIGVPTTVTHRRGDELFPIEYGREVAQLIPGALFIELEGRDHAPYVRSEDLVESIAEHLTGSRPRIDPHKLFAAILFTDIVGSTEHVARLGDDRWRLLLDAYDRGTRRVFNLFDGRNVRSTGDGYLATFDGPVRAIDAALAAREAAARLGLELRAGLHAGECELIADGIGGIAVHLAARVVSLAKPGEILVTNAVPKLTAGADIDFVERGTHQLKGVPDRWQLLAARRGPTSPVSPHGYPIRPGDQRR